MATSNSYDFNQTRDQIITDALVLLSVYSPGATVDSADINICANFLNKMVKAWETKGIHIWTEVEGTVFLREGINRYLLSSSSSDQAGDDVIDTTLTADGSGTSITVDSTVGMTAGDNIGIELDDNTRQWTTIVSVDSATELTLTTALTSAASSGNGVSTYTTHITRPLEITGAALRMQGEVDREVRLIGRQEYKAITSKTTEGPPNKIFYDAKLTNGVLYVWPTPNSVIDRLKISYARTIQDFDSSSDNPDFPVEWLETVTQNLAARVGPIYKGESFRTKHADLIIEAKQSLEEMRLWDASRGSLFVVPDERYD